MSGMGVCMLIVDDGVERIFDSMIELHLDDKSSHLHLSLLFVSLNGLLGMYLYMYLQSWF